MGNYDPAHAWYTWTCQVCRKRFPAMRADALTCGPTCRKARSRLQKKLRGNRQGGPALAGKK
jgi:hypothetical protein